MPLVLFNLSKDGGPSRSAGMFQSTVSGFSKRHQTASRGWVAFHFGWGLLTVFFDWADLRQLKVPQSDQSA